MDGVIGFGYDGGSLAPMIIQAVAWVGVAAACLVAVRHPWARPGLAGGLLGLAVTVTTLADELKIRSDLEGPFYGVTGPPGDEVTIDLPGFIQDQGLTGFLSMVQAAALVLLAMSFVTSAVFSRRAQRSRPA